MFSKCKAAAAIVALGAGQLAQAIFLFESVEQSSRDVAAQIAGDLMKNFYINADIQGVGQLPRPYYWWEAGATFGSVVAYWAYTGDWSLNDIVGTAILSQASPTTDFMMPDQEYDLGNDDQVIWALTAMEAAEHSFPIPASLQSQYGEDVWFKLAHNAWNDIQARWDTSTCNGGLRWQFNPKNSGYTYKSTISNAGLFQLSARLARYTGDSDGTYQAMAEKVYDWLYGAGLIIDDGPLGYMIYDGAQTDSNCSSIDQHRWSYNAGAMYLGAEYLASLGKTQAAEWGPISTNLFHGIQNAFLNSDSAPGVFYELNCEPYGTCNTDQMAFKGLMVRWFAKVSQISNAPYTNALVASYVANSAAAASKACTGGSSKTLCGEKWITGAWDGTTGVGQQMSALEAVQGTLVSKAKIGTKSSPAKRDPSYLGKFEKRSGLSARDYMEMSNEKRAAMQQS